MSELSESTNTSTDDVVPEPSRPRPDPVAAREEFLKIYPEKTRKKRAKQLLVNTDPEKPAEIGANSRTIPGIMTQRGCTYAGCRGVVIGPMHDVLHITHGPVGCSFYSWQTRRNLARSKDGNTNYLQYSMTTDMMEDEIIFGGEKKLAAAIREAYRIFKPKAIAVYATCPVGLIGDDIHTVCRLAKAELGINVFGFSCEGYKGVSQSAGHHIANNGVFKHMVGLNDTPDEAEFRINILGEYNIGGDAWEIDTLLRKCGIHVTATLSGDISYEQVTRCHTVDLNVVQCHRSINYMADMMETKFGIPWSKVNFIGAASAAKSLRKIAKYFDSPKLTNRVEEVIAQEMAALRPVQAAMKARCQGKTAALFVGGSRAHHYQDLFKDIGMTTIAAGYEFAHRDDYEGRSVLPSIKIDADSRNIEELDVEPDAKRFRPRKTDEQNAALVAGGFSYRDYEGMMREIKSTGDSMATLALGHFTSHPAALALETKFQVPAGLMELPIGIAATDAFIQVLRTYSLNGVPAELETERGRLIDTISDMQQYFHQKRVAVAGDSDHVIGLVQFLIELGAKPVYVITGSKGNHFEKRLHELLDFIVPDAKIKAEADFFELHQWIKNAPVDLLIANTYGKFIARVENIPFVRVGFPILDRVGHRFYPTLGYAGAIRLVDLMVNALFDKKDRDCAEEWFELVQ